MTAADSPRAEDAQLEISCTSCGAALLVGEHMRTARCPYCASPSIVERPPSADRPAPSFVVGFVVGRDRAAAAVRKWVKSRSFFARSDFKNAAVDLVRGVYLPAYLYGAVAHTSYSASIGENYTVTETYTTTDAKGRTVTRTRTRTVTEWRRLAGEHSCYVLDVVVTASRGVSNRELEAVEPFDLRALRRYTPAVLSGWLAEDPSLSREECFRHAHDESVDKVGRLLDGFMPGDSHRDLDYTTGLHDEVIDLVLLPVWSFAARFDEGKPPVRLLVNGQTGKVAGKVPISSIKVIVTVLVVLAFVAGLAALVFAAM